MLLVSRLRRQKAWRCEKHHGARGFRVSGIAVDTVTPRSSAKTCTVALSTSAPATIQHWRAATVDNGQKSGEKKPEKLSMMAAVRMFATEERAEKWFIEQRWPDGIKCPHCGSENVAIVKTRKPQPFRCRTCRKHFSVRTGTPMQSSKIPLSKWALGFFLFSSHVKGISSIKLHDDLGIGQKAAWYMGHRIREAWSKKMERFSTTVEFDEAAIGGKEKNRHLHKKYNLGRGIAGKTILAGAKDRGTNQIKMKVIPDTGKESIHQFVHETVSKDAIIYTDELASYKGTPFEHHWVIHGAKEYVRDDVHTNGIESIWALFRRTYHGTHHHMSPKHLQRYANECSGRLNMRGLSTVDKMTMILQDMEGKRVG